MLPHRFENSIQAGEETACFTLHQRLKINILICFGILSIIEIHGMKIGRMDPHWIVEFQRV